jgi:hypothetical protein
MDVMREAVEERAGEPECLSCPYPLLPSGLPLKPLLPQSIRGIAIW